VTTTFAFTEQHRLDYEGDGLTVLRGVIPPALLGDLRRETDKAREIARRKSGPQVQRLQPVYAYDELDHRVFRDFLDLPGLRATVDGVLGSDYRTSDIMGVLLEPAGQAWTTGWHRDTIHNRPERSADEELWRAVLNPRLFSQLNGALYDDHSLWAVPGSHRRRDTAEEWAIGTAGPELSDAMAAPERERACLAHVRRMPGATPVGLYAGDVALYRATGWHVGTYVPYVKRATLHDAFFGPEDRAWREQQRRARESPAPAGTSGSS
jgi:hypothetical protein